MKIIERVNEIQEFISTLRKKKKTIGFVPTMGALHQGHLSLIERAKQENDYCVCSIFVNPIQFNNKEDLAKYPRMMEKDINLLESMQCDVLFAPSEQEMYPEPENTVFDLGGLDLSMEGACRPGHFNGVAIVVKKLFDYVKPDRAYFGQKDFQQLAVISYMVKRYEVPVEIIPCPTMREIDGLAMSSRNTRLSHEEREVAPLIYHVLQQAKVKALTCNAQEIKQWVAHEIQLCPLMKLEYIEIVHADTLVPVVDFQPSEKYTACIAVFLGKVRLIDNINFL